MQVSKVIKNYIKKKCIYIIQRKITYIQYNIYISNNT